MMKIATDKKIIRKIISAVITLALLLSPSTLLWAEDYPAGFLGPGYREYLSVKKQNGYYVDIFTKIDLCQKERVNKRNQVEEILAYADQAAPEAANGILAAQSQQKYNTDNLKREIVQQRLQREGVASANVESGFRYLPHSDGKIEYFKDGLLIRVENERVVDQFGNLSIKNTYNMQYNDKRLLTSYEATVTDKLGNATQLHWYGAKYTGDSVFYGGSNTSANKNISEYYLKEVDSKGNETLTHWNAVSYEGEFLRAFSETIEDKVNGNGSFTRTNITYANNDPSRTSSYHEEGVGSDGLAYTLDRTDIAYNNKEQLSGYHEVAITTQIDGTKTKTTVDTKFKYLGVAHQFGPDVEEPDPDKVLESIVTQSAENADGSIKTETATTTYNYEGDKISGGSGHTEFNGKEAQWQDPATQTLKEGNKFSGSSELKFEILYGKPLVKQVDSLTNYYSPEDGSLVKSENSTSTYNNALLNNLIRLLGNHEHTEITYPVTDPDNTHQGIQDINLTYYYNEKGNFADAKVQGTGSGWEYAGEKGWYGKYEKEIAIDYGIILNRPLAQTYHEDKDYVGMDASGNIKTTQTSSADVNYVYNSYGVAISLTETATTIITTTNDKGETSTTTIVSTANSDWRGGSLKITSGSGKSNVAASDGSSSQTEFWSNYEYDADGRLKGASGGSKTTGDRGKDGNGQAIGTYESTAIDTYSIKDGQALREKSEATGINYGPDGTKTSDFAETTNYTYELKGGRWEIREELTSSTTNGVDGSTETLTKTRTYQRDVNGVISGITQTASGIRETVNGNGGKLTYELKNYNPEFTFDEALGWYLQKEGYDWVSKQSSSDLVTSTIHSEYEYNSYGVAISLTQTTHSTTKITTNSVTSTTTSVETAQSSWRGGSLKPDSITDTSDTSGSDGSSSHNESWTNYSYNGYGQLTGATGGSTSTGKSAEGGTFSSTSVSTYSIKNGQALREKSETTGINYGTNGAKTSDFTETTNYTYELRAGTRQLMKEVSIATSSGEVGSTVTRTKTYQRDTNGVCTGITQTASGTATDGQTILNYKAEFKFDAQIGWYLVNETYDWSGSSIRGGSVGSKGGWVWAGGGHTMGEWMWTNPN